MVRDAPQDRQLRGRWIGAGSTERILDMDFTPEDHPDVVAAAIKERLPSAHPRPVEEKA